MLHLDYVAFGIASFQDCVVHINVTRVNVTLVNVTRVYFGWDYFIWYTVSLSFYHVEEVKFSVQDLEYSIFMFIAAHTIYLTLVLKSFNPTLQSHLVFSQFQPEL